MSIHFIGSNKTKPHSAFAGDSSESESFDFENWLLATGYFIPILWLFCFSSDDLMEHPANADEESRLDNPIRIPCASRESAAKMLRSRASLLNKWFGQKRTLDYHVDLFSGWIDSLPYDFVTLDWYELLAESGMPPNSLEALIIGISNQDDSVRSSLINISEIDPNCRYLTLAEATTGEYTNEEMNNFFRLVGSGDHVRPPWE